MVLSAIEEFDHLGREAFLDLYGYQRARDYFIEHDGRRYDSKAIAGVAHRHVDGSPLRASDFSGGAATVARHLRNLGFTVTGPGNTPPESPVESLLSKITTLRTATSPKTKHPKRHQPLTLLWALGRAANGEPRLAPWDFTRTEIGRLITDFGLVDDRPNPEFPILRLTHVGLWELPGHPNPPSAGGSDPQIWMRRHQPKSGPQAWFYNLVAHDEPTRSHATAILLSKYFHDTDQEALLSRVGLIRAEPTPTPPPSTTPARYPTTTNRIIRDTALAQWIKSLHGHHCQICGLQLTLPTGPYAEGAHIRPLGHPHNGPDEIANLLCLCPNHHTLFEARRNRHRGRPDPLRPSSRGDTRTPSHPPRTRDRPTPPRLPPSHLGNRLSASRASRYSKSGN
ncbi:hypothetical protein Ssi02_51200 [Sinosporangium siamense]|uniref:HNH nuclease domain-containing protein n=2 Tax=Sinosporangium siamense TaxID=1367973 RepID=A0A919RM02_9ACTN|nr:hypothetical protein Ssi02_51200 [Sinosporangium siamense]